MSEVNEISRMQLAIRIAEREKVVSQVKWPHHDCLPTAVAFTHGLPDDYHSLGLHARALVSQAIEASSTIAERNGETTTQNKFVIDDREQTLEDVRSSIQTADKAWVMFGNSKDSHVLGVLKIGDDEYMVANVSTEQPYAKMTAGEITDHLMKYRKYTELGACIIAFKKK